MLCGELQQVMLEFQNTGNTALRVLYVASPTPELFSFGEASLQRQGAHQVTQISLPSDTAACLCPGQTHTVHMWLRAPDTKGITNLEMLFYYENVNSNSNPRYELIWSFWECMCEQNLVYSANSMEWGLPWAIILLSETQSLISVFLIIVWARWMQSTPSTNF